MKELLQYRNQIYGFSALWIIFLHINNHVPTDIPLITPFFKAGNCGVDIFMFLSGYCLTISFEKNSNILLFYKKRVLRLLIPYFLISIPYYILKNFVRTPLYGNQFNALGFIKDITGYSFWFEGLKTTWFVHAIFIFYILFPFLYKVAKKSLYHSILLLISAYIIIALLRLFYTDYALFAIAICRFPAFIAGMILCINNFSPRINKLTLILSAIYLFVCIIVLRIQRYMPHSLSWLFLITYVLPIFFLVAYFSKKLQKKGICFKVGTISLEIYLIHVMILNIMKWYNLLEEYSYFTFLLVPLLSYILSLVVSRLSKYIANLFVKV